MYVWPCHLWYNLKIFVLYLICCMNAFGISISKNVSCIPNNPSFNVTYFYYFKRNSSLLFTESQPAVFSVYSWTCLKAHSKWFQGPMLAIGFRKDTCKTVHYQSESTFYMWLIFLIIYWFLVLLTISAYVCIVSHMCVIWSNNNFTLNLMTDLA